MSRVLRDVVVVAGAVAGRRRRIRRDRVVLRHVHDLRVGGFQHHDVLALLLHGLDLHLVGRLQVARVDRLVAQRWMASSTPAWSATKRFAKLGGPASSMHIMVHRLRETAPAHGSAE